MLRRAVSCHTSCTHRPPSRQRFNVQTTRKEVSRLQTELPADEIEALKMIATKEGKEGLEGFPVAVVLAGAYVKRLSEHGGFKTFLWNLKNKFEFLEAQYNEDADGQGRFFPFHPLPPSSQTLDAHRGTNR